MKAGVLKTAAHDLGILFKDGAVGGLSDGQLLDRFVSGRDEAAFEALVRRHGPLVWAVCRRTLGDHHDTEDAFQAVFLVLARKASCVWPPERLPQWLHGVACRTALKARARVARRRGRERPIAGHPEPEALAHVPREEHLAQLDFELRHLPERYRAAIVLCDLDGLTHREAALRLGCPAGTLSAHLSRARALLARRLSRRGWAVSGGVLATLLYREASAAMPASLIAMTLRGAARFAVVRPAAPTIVRPEVLDLAEGVLKAMLLSKLRFVAAALIVITALGWGGLLVARASGPKGREAERAGSEARPVPAEDPSPARAVAGEGPVLKGRVVDEAGRPLAGAQVVLYSGVATRKRGQEATTDAKGEYRFGRLQPYDLMRDEKTGRLELKIGVEVSHSTHAVRDGKSWRDIRVPLVDGREHAEDFPMVPGGAIDGRVLEEGTAKPVPRLELKFLGPSPERVEFIRYVTTDEQGGFNSRGLFPGEYTVEVNSAGRGTPDPGRVTIEARKTTRANITLKPDPR